MVKIRVAILLLTFFVVGVIGTLAFFYAQGYRLNPDTGNFTPNGLLVIKSNPDGAQVFIDGQLKTATNATIPLPPGTYEVSIKKEGFFEWKKTLNIEKEIVTEATAHLFKTVPSLSAITFSGVLDLKPFDDFTKISYVVPSNTTNADASGLWVLETVNLPLGFSRSPKRITDGNLADVSWIISPDARQILMTQGKNTFLLETSSFTPQAQRTNITLTKDKLLASWEEEKQKRLSGQTRRLPDDMQSVLQRKVSFVIFSPDEDMVLYTASGDETIPENLIKPLPGSSTQKQERNIKKHQTYVYDIKEDRNFLISQENVDLVGAYQPGLINIDQNEVEKPSLTITPTPTSKTLKPVELEVTKPAKTLSWFPTSRNLILSEEGKITIMDYDGTNRQVVFSGSYVAPHAYPTLSLDRLLILTNLGSNGSLPNLYSLSLK